MRWQDIELGNKLLWTVPREVTKADRTHEVPLSPLAIDILEEQPRHGDYVFSSGKRGDKPPAGFSAAKRTMDKTAEVTNWRLHDLRRTAGMNMAKLGIPVFVVSRVLNHAEGGVTRIYAKASYLDEKRNALGTWARKLESLVRERQGNN